MATQITQPAAADAVSVRREINKTPVPPPSQSGSGRLTSLDAFRGFIMLLLVCEGFGFWALKGHPSWTWLASQFDHVAWEGCTFWDLIQPAFTFMVGVAMPFALARRTAEGANTFNLFKHVLWRAFLLI